MDVLDNLDNGNSIDNEPDVGNTVIFGNNTCGVICDRSDNTNPLPLPPESSLYKLHCDVMIPTCDFTCYCALEKLTYKRN